MRNSICEYLLFRVKHATSDEVVTEVVERELPGTCCDRRCDMKSKVQRQTVDLSAFPDLVVIYLGMRVNAWTGLKTLLNLGPQIQNSVNQKPDGLLFHENFIMSLIPVHVGMRQYWRDFDALEAWSRSPPHREWWLDFLRSSRGNRLLARDVFHARRHGGGLRRRTRSTGFRTIRASAACPWADVLGADPSQAGRCAASRGGPRERNL